MSHCSRVACSRNTPTILFCQMAEKTDTADKTYLALMIIIRSFSFLTNLDLKPVSAILAYDSELQVPLFDTRIKHIFFCFFIIDVKYWSRFDVVGTKCIYAMVSLISSMTVIRILSFKLLYFEIFKFNLKSY